MAVSKRLRHEVLRRDNFACRYCGASAPDVKLHVDHVNPVSLGGQDVPENLVASCEACNAGKSATAPDAAVVADVDQRAVEWGRAMQVAIERRAEELALERATAEPFEAAWMRWSVGGNPVPRDANWRNSILRFLAAGLNDQFFEDAIETAMGLDRVPGDEKWRYFCGICWREMDTLQAIARRVADEMADPHGIAGLFVERDPLAPITVRASVEDINSHTEFTAQVHPEFPAVDLGCRYAAAVADALNAPREVIADAESGFWPAMEAAYRAYLAGPIDGAGEGHDRAAKAFDAAAAHAMFRVRLANEAWRSVGSYGEE